MKAATSSELRPVDRSALLQRLDALRRAESEERTLDPALVAALATAATLVVFEPKELLQAHGLAPDGANLQRLLRHAEPTRRVGEGVASAEPPPGPWRLRSAERRRVLAEVGGVEALRAARRRLAGPSTLAQRMVDLLLAGTPVDLRQLPVAELAALTEVRPWYEGLLSPLPDEQQLRARMAMAQLVEPMRRLVGRGFVGRQAELVRLEDYVSLLRVRKVAGSTLLGLAQRVLRQVRRALIDSPPLFIAGPGGVGKSSLLARFILNHVDAPQGRYMPFVMLDFDRAQLEPRMPLSLLVAALHQLRAQFPTHDAAMLRMAEHLSQQMRSADRRSLENVDSLQERLVEDFAKQVESMIGGSGTTLLWVLDTFEEPQRLGESTVGPLWELMNALQGHLPGLRLVVCGRVAPPGFPWDLVALDEFDQPSAIAFLRQRLEEASASHLADDRRLAQVVKVVGRTPLALRLAATLIVREDPQLLNLRLRSERIQAVLFQRVLDHVRVDARLDSPQGAIEVDEAERQRLEDELVKLVFPGLAVRRITQGVIEQVLAGPCGIRLRDPQHVERLFRALAQQVDIVEPGENDGTGPSLLHLTELRRMMLRDLEQKAGEERIRRIDRAAVAYHAAIETLPNCAEEIYHRLRLQQSEATIRGRWEAGLERYLLPALEEITDPPMRVLLAELLGVTLDAEALEGAEQGAWERQAARRSGQYLQAGNPQRALQVLEERLERTHASPLLRLQARALQQLTDFHEAGELAVRALEEAAEAGDLTAAADAALLVAQCEEALGNFEAAAQRVQQAEGWLIEFPDRAQYLRTLAARLRLARKRGAPAAEQDALARKIAAGLTGEVRRGLRARPAALRELVAELGIDDERLLLLGLDVIGLDLPSYDEVRPLATALADATASDPHAQKGAFEIALAHGVVGKGGDKLPDAGEWAGWLWNASPREGGELVRNLLKLPLRDRALNERLAGLFRADVDRRIFRHSRARAV